MSRNGDLHPHAHVLVANVVRCPDGKWRAHASARQLYADQSLLNAVFQKHVADRLQWEYGLDVVRDGAGFKLRGFPDDRVRAASSRTADIDRFCQERGWTTPEQRQLAAYLTRPEKREYRLAERWPRWQDDTQAVLPTSADRMVFFCKVPPSASRPNDVVARAARYALDAADALSAGRGPFTVNQIRAESLLRSIGDPRIGVAAVEAAVERVCATPDLARLWRGGRSAEPVFYWPTVPVPASAVNHRAERLAGDALVSRVKATATSTVVATAETGRDVAARFRAADDRQPPVIHLHGGWPDDHPLSVAGYARKLKPMPYWRAHKDALKRGLLDGTGGLRERLDTATRHFRDNRRPEEKLQKRQVVVVSDPDAAPRKALAALEKYARKARASVVYADTPALAPTAEKSKTPPGRHPEPQRDRT